MELSDEGTSLFLEVCRPLSGALTANMDPAKRTVVNADILASFWMVRRDTRHSLPNPVGTFLYLIVINHDPAQLAKGLLAQTA